MQHLLDVIRTVPDFPKPGVGFRDITPLLGNAAFLDQMVDALAAPFVEEGITRVVGVECRGFILGPMLAHRLGAGFVPVRKKGKLPYATYAEEYALEYGTDTMEMHTDALAVEDRVLIHDDVLATGGTAAACLRLVERAGPRVMGFSFLLELGFLRGRSLLREGLRVHSVLAD